MQYFLKGCILLNDGTFIIDMRNAMKKEKKHWLHLYNRILSGGLVLLGFSACENNGTGADEYGTPYCRFEIKGKVQDELQQPVSDARIIVKELMENGKPSDPYYFDTVYTRKNGKFQFLDEDAGSMGKYRVVCEDTSGENKADSVELKMEPKGGKGWFRGEDSKEVDFNLKKKDE